MARRVDPHGFVVGREVSRHDSPTVPVLREAMNENDTRTVSVDFRVEQEDSVYPMVPAGADLDNMIRRPMPEGQKHNPIYETGED